MADYSPEQRQKNQRTISLVTAGAVAVVIVRGQMLSWTTGSHVVAFVFIAMVAVGPSGAVQQSEERRRSGRRRGTSR